MRACSTFANSSCSCSYDKVVISACDQVWDAIVCPLAISLLAYSSFPAKVGELMRKKETEGDVLRIQISNIINVIINTVIVLTLFISSSPNTDKVEEEG
jgi:hypothetical protein